MPVQESTIEGDGMLRDRNDTETAVHYSFRIRTTIVTRPGLPPTPGHSEGWGQVNAVDATHFPDGIYHITTSQGHRMRLQKLGHEWHILAMP